MRRSFIIMPSPRFGIRRSTKIELIDLSLILPLDVETITESVNRTDRLFIVHEAGMTVGVGGSRCRRGVL